MMSNRRQLDSTTRENLAQDQEFLRFLQERKADAQRDADRLQSEIETLMCQVDSKRREQAEHLNIVMACDGGLAKQTRPAPSLTPRVAAMTIEAPK